MREIDRKFARLKKVLSAYDGIAVAFSGGKDGALVIRAGVEILERSKIVALTAVSPIRRPDELGIAEDFCRELGIRHEIARTQEYKKREFIENEAERCFICKTELFENLGRAAKRSGISTLVDGTNADDAAENRRVFSVPISFGVKWPLVEAGIGTKDVEALLKDLGLGRFARPHYSCSAWEIDLRAAAG